MRIRLLNNPKNNLSILRNISPANIIFLFIVVVLTLPSFGCGTTMFASESKYVVPNLPESELATIQIDTDGQWIQRINQVALRINGKLALRKKLTEDTKDTNHEVLVVPGKHAMSVLVLTDTYPDGVRKDLQITSNLSAEVKAGITYFLKGKFDNSVDDDLTVELIDTSTDEVISKSKITTKSTFDRQQNEQSSSFSVEYEF